MMKFAVDTAPVAEQRVLLRAATVLLYSHWEGFVKKSGTAYVEFVAHQKLRLDQLKSNFVAISLASKITACGASRKMSLRLGLVDHLTIGRSSPAGISWNGAVKTKSNLSGGVFREIVSTLGLDFAPYALREHTVINTLVRQRNAIAHGQTMPVDAADYEQLHQGVVSLLDDFKTHLERAASQGEYLT